MKSLRLDQFETERPKLISLAYRMLGELSAAEDIVQEAWLRWSKADGREIRNPSAWLCRVTARIAIDELRSARSRRETYVGPWLPEPLIKDSAGSTEDSYVLAEECHLALLWAMERLTPEERAAFILRSVFDADYADLAGTLKRSEAACRQLVSRARKKVRAGRPQFVPTSGETIEMLAKFASATMAQDHETVLSLLAPDVTALTDGGGKVRAAFRPLRGAAEVSSVLLSIAAKNASAIMPKLVQANGTPALAILEGTDSDLVLTLAVSADGLIDWIYIMRNPEKLPSHREMEAKYESRTLGRIN